MRLVARAREVFKRRKKRHVLDRPIPIKKEVTKALEHFRSREKVPGSDETDPNRIEEINESHAREWFTRAVLLPITYKTYGKRFKAAVIRGSVQTGIRKATRRERKEDKPSDLDVQLIVDYEHMSDRKMDRLYDRFNSRLSRVHSEDAHGFGVFKAFVEPDLFEDTETQLEAPFQVVYGRKFLVDLLGEEHMTQRRNRAVPYKSKYVE